MENCNRSRAKVAKSGGKHLFFTSWVLYFMVFASYKLQNLPYFFILGVFLSSERLRVAFGIRLVDKLTSHDALWLYRPGIIQLFLPVCPINTIITGSVNKVKVMDPS